MLDIRQLQTYSRLRAVSLLRVAEVLVFQMRIVFSRSGGFAGIPLQVEIDTTGAYFLFGVGRERRPLTNENVQRIVDLVRQSNFFSFPQPPDRHPAGPDEFTYSVSIENGGSRTLRLSETELPEDLEPLLNVLESLAKGIVPGGNPPG
jgi:hypothetical protein